MTNLLVVMASLIAISLVAYFSVQAQARIVAEHERSHREMLVRHLTFAKQQGEYIVALTENLVRNSGGTFIAPRWVTGGQGDQQANTQPQGQKTERWFSTQPKDKYKAGA